MKIIKLAERENEVPPGFMMIEVTVDEMGKQSQKIIRGGKSKCSKADQNLLKDLLSIDMGEWGDGGSETATGLTHEGEQQETEERMESYEKERVKPSVPVIPTKKPVVQSPTPPPKKKRLFQEI